MDVKRFYQEIKGNYQNAVSIMMNDALIARMLTKFMANNDYEKIISAYEAKDFQSLFAAVHAFKGVTGNLALTPLYELSCVITEATRNNPNPVIDQEISQLKEVYACVKSNYEKYIG